MQRVALQGQPLATAATPVAEVQAGQPALSPDGQRLYGAGAQVFAWDAHTLKLQWATPPVPPARSFSGFLSQHAPSPLAVSPDGLTLATAGTRSGEVDVRDARSGRLQRTIPHPRPSEITADNAWSLDATALAYDPAGRQLAIGTLAGGIRLYDLVTGQERLLSGRCGKSASPFLTAHHGPVNGLAWTGPATLVSTAHDETMRRWDTSSGREVNCLSIPGGAQGLQVLPGDRLLALGATSATLVDAGKFRRLALLGPFASRLRDLRVLGTTIRLSDGLSDRGWTTGSGRATDVRGRPLATLNQQGVGVQVGPDMRVTVVQNGRARTLTPLAVPPSNFDGSGFPSGWTMELSGGVLTVAAKSSVQTGVVEMTDIQNVFQWNLETGRLERCDTTLTSFERDRACPGKKW
ncbi:WD40 repeat domain-containing protein (plasmid) [Deinococcus radiomollis]|uniref:WD40 repeat domain-containing protein n=1 Tax=Deinococcus radiomollis TaxID=468916 RepID=UPI0038915197